MSKSVKSIVKTSLVYHVSTTTTHGRLKRKHTGVDEDEKAMKATDKTESVGVNASTVAAVCFEHNSLSGRAKLLDLVCKILRTQF